MSMSLSGVNSSVYDVCQSVTKLPGIGRVYAKRLTNRNINTVGDICILFIRFKRKQITTLQAIFPKYDYYNLPTYFNEVELKLYFTEWFHLAFKVAMTTSAKITECVANCIENVRRLSCRPNNQDNTSMRTSRLTYSGATPTPKYIGEKDFIEISRCFKDMETNTEPNEESDNEIRTIEISSNTKPTILRQTIPINTEDTFTSKRFSSFSQMDEQKTTNQLTVRSTSRYDESPVISDNHYIDEENKEIRIPSRRSSFNTHKSSSRTKVFSQSDATKVVDLMGSSNSNSNKTSTKNSVENRYEAKRYESNNARVSRSQLYQLMGRVNNFLVNQGIPTETDDLTFSSILPQQKPIEEKNKISEEVYDFDMNDDKSEEDELTVNYISTLIENSKAQRHKNDAYGTDSAEEATAEFVDSEGSDDLEYNLGETNKFDGSGDAKQNEEKRGITSDSDNLSHNNSQKIVISRTSGEKTETCPIFTKAEKTATSENLNKFSITQATGNSYLSENLKISRTSEIFESSRRKDEIDISSKSVKPEKSKKWTKVEISGKSERPKHSRKSEITERSRYSAKPEKSRKSEKHEKSRKSEKPEKSRKTEIFELSRQSTKVEKSRKTEQYDKSRKSEKYERPQKLEKHERPQKLEKYEKSRKSETYENSRKSEKYVSSRKSTKPVNSRRSERQELSGKSEKREEPRISEKLNTFSKSEKLEKSGELETSKSSQKSDIQPEISRKSEEPEIIQKSGKPEISQKSGKFRISQLIEMSEISELIEKSRSIEKIEQFRNPKKLEQFRNPKKLEQLRNSEKLEKLRNAENLEQLRNSEKLKQNI
ncbi:hypothetical protein SNEBB_006267 [Seison nebaliae]|nr:hypothetical protein SNEBB_006267 [Seison nebaliae]